MVRSPRTPSRTSSRSRSRPRPSSVRPATVNTGAGEAYGSAVNSLIAGHRPQPVPAQPFQRGLHPLALLPDALRGPALLFGGGGGHLGGDFPDVHAHPQHPLRGRDRPHAWALGAAGAVDATRPDPPPTEWRADRLAAAPAGDTRDAVDAGATGRAPRTAPPAWAPHPHPPPHPHPHLPDAAVVPVAVAY